MKITQLRISSSKLARIKITSPKGDDLGAYRHAVDVHNSLCREFIQLCRLASEDAELIYDWHSARAATVAQAEAYGHIRETL